MFWALNVRYLRDASIGNFHIDDKRLISLKRNFLCRSFISCDLLWIILVLVEVRSFEERNNILGLRISKSSFRLSAILQFFIILSLKILLNYAVLLMFNYKFTAQFHHKLLLKFDFECTIFFLHN